MSLKRLAGESIPVKAGDSFARTHGERAGLQMNAPSDHAGFRYGWIKGRSLHQDLSGFGVSEQRDVLLANRLTKSY